MQTVVGEVGESAMLGILPQGLGWLVSRPEQSYLQQEGLGLAFAVLKNGIMLLEETLNRRHE